VRGGSCGRTLSGPAAGGRLRAGELGIASGSAMVGGGAE
jgi:hypothetical protein